MGHFRIVIDGVGGHGCQRDVKDGGQVFGCRQQGCPDCVTQEFFEKMTKIASSVTGKFHHWPGTPTEVVDEFQADVRSVKSYLPSKYDPATGKIEAVPDAKEVHYVDWIPAHRVRKGNF